MKILIILLMLSNSLLANTDTQHSQDINNLNDNKNDSFTNKPLIERFVLDELVSLRSQQQQLKVDVVQQISENKVKNSDRVIEYTTSTLNNIFYIVTIAASLLVLLGWRSISDVRSSLDEAINKRLNLITHKYEERLDDMEKKIKMRSEEIIANQEEISHTNMTQALWMRAGLEKSNREKIKIYDQILSIKKNDIQALTYKADVLLDIDQESLALDLSNQAIEIDPNYSLAYWQRACAKSELGLFDEAIEDIKKAISISHPLKDKIEEETHFEKLHTHKDFKELITSS